MAVEPKIWTLEPHTKAKHDLLQYYLGGWFPILSSYNGRIVFIDGFAGPGIYKADEPGSPVIALTTLLEHGHLQRMSKCEFLFVFCENDQVRVASLQQQIEILKAKYKPFPAHVKIEIVPQAFAETARDILDGLSTGPQKKNLAPTFAFVDPFGFSGVPMDLLRDLLVYDRCELFMNLMVDHINRFATNPKVSRHMDELFGSRDYMDVVDAQPGTRVQFLHDLYKRKLAEVCGFRYVQSFGMIGNNGHLSYYLMHGTRHIKGASLMKDAMWKIDPGGGCTFSDRMANQDVLFQADPDFRPLRDGLLSSFAGRTVGIGEIETWVIVDTPYRGAHLRRPVLTPLEKAGVITVQRPGKSGFPDGTTLTFP